MTAEKATREKNKAISFQHLDLIQEVPYTMHLSKSLEALFSFKPLLWLARHHRITPRAEYLRLSDVSLKRFLCFERIVIVSSGQILIAFPGQSWHQAPSAQGNLITSLPLAHSEEQSLHSTVICLRPTCSHTSPYNDR